jgi:hypothetical protein
MVGGMLGSNDHAIHVGPNEGRLEPPEARRLVRGGSHRIRRSAGADPRRSIPFRAGGEKSSWATRPVAAFSWSPSWSALGLSASSAHDVQRDMSAKTMKKRRGPRTRHVAGDLVSEYRFDYAKSRPNRFARQIAKNAVVVVVLDPDVAAVFRDPKRVNSLLRATIAALKKSSSRRAG